MVQLTVGYVAGIIAASMFLGHLWSPNALTFVVSGLLSDRNSAATWNVAGRAFQRSLWPDLLQSDSARTHGVRKDILFVTTLSTFMGILITVAGIVTPLGLYDALVPSYSRETTFKYLKDLSPFGYATPARSNLTFNRECGGFSGLVPCPFSDTIVLMEVDDNGNINGTYPHGYDMNIPQIIQDIYSSGVDNHTTISNYFDIEWRRYVTTSEEKVNNGSTYLVSAFRLMESMVLNNAIQPVEGLIVDTVNGGIGFRNHTVPPGFQHGATWSEDILFIEPESVCVDTNTTLDYTISQSQNLSTTVTNLVLTDRGGFVDLVLHYPEANLTDTQKNPDLWTRAYKAAWMTNTWSMLYFNITNPHNDTTDEGAFQYLNSELGKTFPIPNMANSVGPQYYDSLGLDSGFNFHLQIGTGIGNASDPGSSGLPPNPFAITDRNFTDISLICAGAGGLDYANITNIFVTCGLMHGIPQRQDDGPTTMLDSGSRWSQPLYACASTVKASVKTVTFVFNGTDNLQNLAITDVKEKSYDDESSMPLWGVENTDNAYYINDIQLIWGLISSDYEHHENVSAVRQPSLYLPGYGASVYSNRGIGFDNLPGSGFFQGSMAAGYDVGLANSPAFDYSGESNMAMWVRWQNLSRSPETASMIPNLIFTDYAAASVVGTKGVLGYRNAASNNMVHISVTPTILRIKYHWPFAVPALLAAFLLLATTVAAAVTICLGRGGIRRMRSHLQQISPGRVFTSFLYPDQGGMSIRSQDWSKQLGKKMIDISGEYPVAADVMLESEKEVRVDEYGRSISESQSAEGQGLVSGFHHERDTSQGDIGGYGFAPPPQEYGVKQVPLESSFTIHSYR